MKLLKIDINSVKSPAYNPRKKLTPEDAEYQQLKRSIESWGYVDPIIFNKRTMHIVGGNQRWAVLKDLGRTEIDAVEIDVDESNEQALNVALNKISGEWDDELLKRLLTQLNEKGFDITMTGFDEHFILEGIEDPLKEWQGMPDFISNDISSWHFIVVHFKNAEDLQAFSELVQQPLNEKSKFIWYPKQQNADLKSYAYEDQDTGAPSVPHLHSNQGKG